eukprot:GFUD01085714.1.p1 GENE.GFUD01085714.1~~GFUD01085714.1.p1  ORF type:complete len:252 (+),score=30.23 GFUD01085714.1:41-796(+)
MGLKNVDWQKCLGRNTRIPHDISFTFPDEKDSEDIGAHKMMLAMVSDVFYGQFYGSIPEAKNIIPVKDSAREAFKIMIEFIYNKTPDWARFTDFELYFEVYKLADFYLIKNLESAVLYAIQKLEITETNFRELSSCADRYDHLEKLSNTVLENCALFLCENFGSFQKILEFINIYKGDPGILLKIMRMIRRDHGQGYYTCLDCFPNRIFTLCKFCIETCHEGHQVNGPTDSTFYCDCGSGGLATKQQPCKL